MGGETVKPVSAEQIERGGTWLLGVATLVDFAVTVLLATRDGHDLAFAVCLVTGLVCWIAFVLRVAGSGSR